MSYFAEINQDGIVQRVIVAEQDFIDSGAMGDPKNWIETFDDGSQRGRYATKGGQYFTDVDKFLPPKKHDSWIADKEKAEWVAPVEKPNDTKIYDWDEVNLEWKISPLDAKRKGIISPDIVE